jgi:hypothetical protein
MTKTPPQSLEKSLISYHHLSHLRLLQADHLPPSQLQETLSPGDDLPVHVLLCLPYLETPVRTSKLGLLYLHWSGTHPQISQAARSMKKCLLSNMLLAPQSKFRRKHFRIRANKINEMSRRRRNGTPQDGIHVIQPLNSQMRTRTMTKRRISRTSNPLLAPLQSKRLRMAIRSRRNSPISPSALRPL